MRLCILERGNRCAEDGGLTESGILSVDDFLARHFEDVLVKYGFC